MVGDGHQFCRCKVMAVFLLDYEVSQQWENVCLLVLVPYLFPPSVGQALFHWVGGGAGGRGAGGI